jgi:hypothetical protein
VTKHTPDCEPQFVLSSGLARIGLWVSLSAKPDVVAAWLRDDGEER